MTAPTDHEPRRDAARDLRNLADERAALRQVSELVAREVDPGEVLSAVVAQASGLVGVDFTTLLRFEPDGSSQVAAVHGAPPGIEVGLRGPGSGRSSTRSVHDTGRPSRVDDLSTASGHWPQLAYRLGYTSSAAAPVVIRGEIWGVLVVTGGHGPLPPGLEDQLAAFAELTGTAISSAQTRIELRRVAAEQAALRRLAEIAVRGGSPQDVFDAITRETRLLIEADAVALASYQRDESAVIVSRDGITAGIDAGTHQPAGGDGVLSHVLRSQATVRIDRSTDSPGDRTFFGGQSEAQSIVGAPIQIDGKLWGVLAVATMGAPLATDTAADVTRFAGLLGTAISGAEARTNLQRLYDEQAALRRVAELVARGAGRAELFAAVADEAVRLIDGRGTVLLRVDTPTTMTVVAASGDTPVDDGAELVVPADDGGVARTVLRTGLPARVDDYAAMRGPAFARDSWGVNSSVGAPIVIDGAVWGVIAVAAGERYLPIGAEMRLQQFGDLVAGALATAQARDDLQQLADEQAALRRVAELVARTTDPDEVFAAVAVEASLLLDDAAMTLTRFDGDWDLVVVASCNGPVPVGGRITYEPNTQPDLVRRQATVSRIDDYTEAPDAALAERFGLRASVSAPILILNEVWGTLTATSTGRPLDAGTGLRLSQFAELVAASIANAEGRAEITASRARVLASADEARRRLQRDIHDGAQSRLVQAVITLKLISARIGPEHDELRELVDEAASHAQRANTELRDIVHGILPGPLVRSGLLAGLRSIAADLPFPVELDVETPRLATSVETTAYFIVAEALANVVKHAHAARARVHVRYVQQTATLDLRVSDDGVGGADPDRGSGLTGLADRAAARGGVLTVESEPGRGTTVIARLPASAEPGDGSPVWAA